MVYNFCGLAALGLPRNEEAFARAVKFINENLASGKLRPAIAAPLQATLEISLGIVLVLGLLTRPAAFVAFLYLGSLWVSEWGTAWIWELLVPIMASLALSIGNAGRTWGLDALLARRWPDSLLW